MIFGVGFLESRRKDMKYLVVGAKGQLGQELVKLLMEHNFDYISYESTELDITDRTKVFEIFKKEKPDVILDAAAYTAVDKAESEGKDINWLVNVEGTKNLAEAAKEINATLIFVSTDYVFDGTKVGSYLETDIVNPQNEYGKAKLAGERAVLKSGSKYFIIRTSWVFGEFGNNFVHTMQRLGRDLDTVKVVNDQYGRPTWTRTLAEFMLHLIATTPEQGVYNLSNDGTATWYEFANEILRDENVTVLPVTSTEFPTSATRPKNSVLDLQKSKDTGFNIPTWIEALHLFEQSEAL